MTEVVSRFTPLVRSITPLGRIEKLENKPETNPRENKDLLAGHIDYKGLNMVTTTTKYMDKLTADFQFQSSDIVITTFPRSGTLLTSEIVWHIKNKHLIKPGGQYGEMSQRVPFLEMDAYGVTTAMNMFENNKGLHHRLMKTHLPKQKLWPLLEHSFPTLPKVIVTLRNPKDVAVSMYHFYHNFPEFESWPYHDWNLFIEHYMKGKTMYNDILEASRQWWDMRHHPNLLMVRYESLIREPHQQIRRIANHINETLTPEQEDIIVEAIQFKSMSAKPEVNFTFPVTGGHLMRKGTIGDWKNYFTINQNDRMDRLIYQKLGSTGLTFEYE